MSDTISRQAAIERVLAGKLSDDSLVECVEECNSMLEWAADVLKNMPSAQPEHLTDEDFETIRIHLNAYKEQLCNQHRWEEAEEYQRIIDRFIAFASAEPERKKGKWIEDTFCSECGWIHEVESGFIGSVNQFNYCPNCGARMENGDGKIN